MCAELNGKLDDIIYTIDESVDFMELYTCEVCDAIVSGSKIFKVHESYCAEG